MLAAELAARIAKGENLHTEFKSQLPHADDLAAALVAFANTDGGDVFLGVDDGGATPGVADVDRTAQRVDNVAYNNCSPPVTVLQETVATETGTVLVVRVPRGEGRPYRTNRGAYYTRTASGRRHASREELLRLFQADARAFYDETPVQRSTAADLDAEAADEMLEAIREQGRGLVVAGLPQRRLLANWGLIGEGTGTPTVAGILLLGAAPQRFLPHAYVSALRIPGTELATPPMDQKRLNGRAFDLLVGAERFLEFHLLRRHRIRGMEPEVVPELPLSALREVLVNAVAHRDYTVAGPIRVLVFEDRVEVRSPGGLPNSVRLAQLPAGVHVLRNPTLYNLLLKRGLATDAGSGIPRLIQLVREQTGRAPTLRLAGDEFVVTLPRTANEPDYTAESQVRRQRG